jgi:acyl carrier protein
MTRDEIRNTVTGALAQIAPEVDAASLLPDQPLRDQVDLDSMDFLRFVLELHTQLRVEIAEADYGKLATIAGAVDYLASRLAVA